MKFSEQIEASANVEAVIVTGQLTAAKTTKYSVTITSKEGEFVVSLLLHKVNKSGDVDIHPHSTKRMADDMPQNLHLHGSNDGFKVSEGTEKDSYFYAN